MVLNIGVTMNISGMSMWLYTGILMGLYWISLGYAWGYNGMLLDGCQSDVDGVVMYINWILTGLQWISMDILMEM